MRYLKVAVTFVASVVLSGLLGLAGCDDDHGRHFRGGLQRAHFIAGRLVARKKMGNHRK